MGARRGTVKQRLARRTWVNFKTGCWEWRGHKTRKGYGMMWGAGRAEAVHRISYRVWAGEIPEGLELDHLCRNKLCVNPDHLEPVTSEENLRRAREAVGHYNSNKTHCKYGHLYDKDNTQRSSSKGARRCGKCHAKKERERRLSKRCQGLD